MGRTENVYGIFGSTDCFRTLYYISDSGVPRDSVEKTRRSHDDGLSKTWSTVDEKKTKDASRVRWFLQIYNSRALHIGNTIYYLNAQVTSSGILMDVVSGGQSTNGRKND